MMDALFFQKRQKDDQKPLEEKIKTLKKRNAELAAIARRLEEKAKHLQQENMKVAILLLVGRGKQWELKPTGKHCCQWRKPIIHNFFSITFSKTIKWKPIWSYH